MMFVVMMLFVVALAILCGWGVGWTWPRRVDHQDIVRHRVPAMPKSVITDAKGGLGLSARQVRGLKGGDAPQEVDDWVKDAEGTLELTRADWVAGRNAIARARSFVGVDLSPRVLCTLRTAVAAGHIAEKEGWADVHVMWNSLGHGEVKIVEDVEFKLLHSGA